jgi:hypothetical protein
MPSPSDCTPCSEIRKRPRRSGVYSTTEIAAILDVTENDAGKPSGKLNVTAEESADTPEPALAPQVIHLQVRLIG